MTRIVIAGAGVAGLTSALALARTGASVTLLERAASLEEVGAGVQLSPNATRILGRLGVLDDLQGHAVKPEAIRIRAAKSGGTIIAMSLRDVERRWGAPYLVALRAHLQQALRAAVSREDGISLHLDTAVAGFGATADGVAVAARQNGISRAFEGDALIGADGVRSIVRARLVDREDPARETGRVAWRALVPHEVLGPDLTARETCLWLGRDAHLVHYPVGDGRMINVVAITSEPPGNPLPDVWASPGDPTVIGARFAAWHRAARDLIAAAPGWTRWMLFDREPLANWAAGRIALIGDAAHPILPFLAQGSAQAIEDSAALAAAIVGQPDLPTALASYSAARRERATRVQAASRRLGRIYHLGGAPSHARNLGMRVIGGTRLLAHYDWLYGYDANERDIVRRAGLR